MTLLALILTAITLLVLWAILRGIVWLLSEGYFLWQQNQREKALVYWCIVGAVVLIPVVSIVNNQQEQARRQQERVVAAQTYQTEIQRAEQVPLRSLVTVTVIAHGLPSTILGCQYYCDRDTYAQYRVTNNAPIYIKILSTLNRVGLDYCSDGRWGWIADTVLPNQTITAYCRERYQEFRTPTPNCLNVQYASPHGLRREVVCG